MVHEHHHYYFIPPVFSLVLFLPFVFLHLLSTSSLLLFSLHLYTKKRNKPVLNSLVISLTWSLGWLIVVESRVLDHP